MSIKLKVGKKFDFSKKRLYINDVPIVLQCHHYTTLLTQLANDAAKFNGPQIMFSAAKETFYTVLTKYFKENNITSYEDRASIVEQYYAYIGLGLMKINIKEFTVELLHSHLDEAWLKKWSVTDNPVNYITQGFLAAAFSAVTDNNQETFNVKEIQSIACGAETSKFIIERKQEK